MPSLNGWAVAVALSTPKQTYKQTHYIFMLVQRVKLCYTKFYYINKPRLCQDSTNNFISKCLIRLGRRNPSKFTLDSKINTFDNNIKYSTETLPIYILDCLKMLLIVMIKDDYESKFLTQSDW